jgi:Haem-binding domain
MRHTLAWGLLATLLIASLGFTRIPHSAPVIPGRTLFANVRVPQTVAHTLRIACGNCHSNETRWPWYAYTPVTSYLVQKDVSEARAHLNMSDWQKIADQGPEELAAGFSGICENLLSGAMPKRQYLWLRPEARLSKTQIAQVCEWAQSQQMSVLARGYHNPR